MSFDLNKELHTQEHGEWVRFTAPNGKPVHFQLSRAQGNTRFYAACEQEQKKIEKERLDGRGKNIKNLARLEKLRAETAVSNSEFAEIQRRFAVGRLFHGFKPGEWNGLQVTKENLERMLEVDWVWVLVRGWAILGDDEDAKTLEEEAEKKSVASGDGSSDTDDAPEKSPDASETATKSTKRK